MCAPGRHDRSYIDDGEYISYNVGFGLESILMDYDKKDILQLLARVCSLPPFEESLGNEHNKGIIIEVGKRLCMFFVVVFILPMMYMQGLAFIKALGVAALWMVCLFGSFFLALW